MHLRNAPTRLMRELGYGRAYRYAHDEPEGYAAGEDYFPEGLQGRRYYGRWGGGWRSGSARSWSTWPSWIGRPRASRTCTSPRR